MSYRRLRLWQLLAPSPSLPCSRCGRGNLVVVALTIRDCYEAFVVYSFLTLILEHAGGDYNCIEQIKHLPPVRLGHLLYL